MAESRMMDENPITLGGRTSGPFGQCGGSALLIWTRRPPNNASSGVCDLISCASDHQDSGAFAKGVKVELINFLDSDSSRRCEGTLSLVCFMSELNDIWVSDHIDSCSSTTAECTLVVAALFILKPRIRDSGCRESRGSSTT